MARFKSVLLMPLVRPLLGPARDGLVTGSYGMTHNFAMSVTLKADVGTDMPRCLLNANHLIAPRQISPLSDHIGGGGNQ